MKYLFISSHVDDSDLACGATMADLIERGHEIHVLTLSTVYEGVDLLSEWVDSMKVLGVHSTFAMGFKTRHFHESYDEILQSLFSFKGYDFIFAPSAEDFHSDHSTVGRACERVFKNDNLITYQHPWNSRELKYNYFVQLEKRHIDKKIEALACYKSQAHRNYMNPDYILANAVNTGAMVGLKYAECFNVVNMIA